MPSHLNASFLKATLLAGVFAALLGFTAISTPITPASASNPTVAARSADKQPIMLADEIIRRLRRLGLNFTKNRIPRPYDPYGEIC